MQVNSTVAGAGRLRLRGRNGVTLIELMITLVLLGIVAGGMMQIIVRQQKFYQGSSSVLATRSNVRQGVAVFQSDLRAINPGRDIYAGGMTATSLEFREPKGSSVVCAIDGAHTTIVVPPPVLSNGAGLTSWVQPPEVGDSVLIYDPGAGAWLASGRRIIGTQPTEGSGSCTDLLEAADRPRGWQITLDDVLPDTLALGASIRFFRKAHYELKQAADGDWYLAFGDCLPGRSPECMEAQPMAGPYLAPDNDPPGLELRYFDEAGVATSDPKALRRIDIALRSRSSAPIDMDGRSKGFYSDSLKASIAVRNLQ